MLATEDDVRNRLRRDLTSSEEEWVPALIEESSVLVTGYLKRRGFTIGDDVPPEVMIVVSRMVARALTAPEAPNMPEGVTSLDAGPFGIRFGDPYTSSVFISSGDEKWLKNLLPSVVSLSFVSERGDFTDGCELDGGL